MAIIAMVSRIARKIKWQMRMRRNRRRMEKTARKRIVNVQRARTKKDAAVTLIETEIVIVVTAGTRNAIETVTAIVGKIDGSVAAPRIVVVDE